MTTPTLYETIYAHVQDADITHYQATTSEENPENEMISGFRPVNDPEYALDYENPISHGGKTYIPVCWGESETSAILESALDEICYIRYVFDAARHIYVSDGNVYETEEAAKRGRD